MQRQLLFSAYAILFICLWIPQLEGQGILPPGFSDELVTKDIDQAIGFVWDYEGKMYLWEKAGKVKVFDKDGLQLEEPLIDISEEVGNWRDHGLLGFALDPSFEVNGHYYLLYVMDRHHLEYFGTPTYHPDSSSSYEASIGRLVRFTADPATNFTTTVPGSKKILLGASKDDGILCIHESHGIGALVFGQDGSLFVSAGDGNSTPGIDLGTDSLGAFASDAIALGLMTKEEDIGVMRSQYLNSYSGKILRIDPETGNGLPTNPWYDSENPASKVSKVWSLGYRNPFKMILIPETGSHDPEDGDPGILVVGDVGGGGYEEITIVDKGGVNAGWPFIEGPIPHWGYWAAPRIPNPMAPNPLFGNGCNQEFFHFFDLFKRANQQDDYQFTNPCDRSRNIPADISTYVVQRPVFSYSNALWNPPPRAFDFTWDEEGRLTAITLEDSLATIDGNNFAGASSIPGAFYTGDAFPEPYNRAYYHMDFSSGWIKAMYFNENFEVDSVRDFHSQLWGIIHIQEHPTDGSLWYLKIGEESEMRKIRYGDKDAPLLDFTATPLYGSSPLEVRFDASASISPINDSLTFLWNFGDGNSATNAAVTHIYTAADNNPEQFTAEIEILDESGRSKKGEQIIHINNSPPSIDITSFEDGDYYPTSGYSWLPLRASVSDQESTLEELDIEWQVFFHHNTHFHPQPPIKGLEARARISPEGCGEELFWFRIRLKVTDPQGMISTVEKSVYPYCGPPIVDQLDLSAEAEKEKIKIEWSVLGQKNLDHYVLTRTQDEKEIGIFPASPDQTSFKTEDLNPIEGKNTYQITYFDKNGVYDISKAVTVTWPINYLAPNPFEDALYLELTDPKTSEASIELYNALGQTVLSRNYSVPVGLPFRTNILKSSLESGVYYYRLVTDGKKYTGIVVAK